MTYGEKDINKGEVSGVSLIDRWRDDPYPVRLIQNPDGSTDGCDEPIRIPEEESHKDVAQHCPDTIAGAIVGDIVGSIYEFNNIKTKDFPLFTDECFFTDDTVMTIAIYEGLRNGGKPDDYIDSMKKYGRMFPKESYGGNFNRWLKSADRKPYNSFGNGSAMRVSAIVEHSKSLEDAERNAEISAAVTHNHPEGIKGAKATVAAAFLAKNGKSKEEIKAYIESTYKYDLNSTLDEIRPTYGFNETCQKTVPEAIIAFLESKDFEDAIRNAISLGGDSDTLAAIAGTIAGAAYGVPLDIWENAEYYLDERINDAFSE